MYVILLGTHNVCSLLFSWISRVDLLKVTQLTNG